MPKATASLETKRLDLDTVEGGYIVIRRMNFGQQLAAQDDSVKAVSRDKGRGKNGSKGDTEFEMQIMSSSATAKAFAYCIVDHNLDDGADPPRKLDFTDIKDLFSLDLAIADEINDAINAYNKVGDSGKSPTKSGELSPTG